MPVKKLALAALLATIIILYFVGGGDKYLNIGLYQGLFDQSPLLTAAVFVVIFVVGTACSLPVTGALIVISGLIFGHLAGFALSIFSCTLGGALSLLSARILFKDFIQRRFSTHIDVINKGIEKEGALYVFGIRMVPVVPFWLLNLLVGLTSMPVLVFMLATALGMVPVTLILTYAGSQLGQVESFSMAAIFTPGMILSLCLLATFPFLAKAIVKLAQRYAQTRGSG